MSHVVIRSVPFVTQFRIGSGGAKDLIARDRSRAQKLIAGLHPFGPLPRKHRRHHPHPHPHPRLEEDAVKAAASPTGSGQSIDVSDSGVTYTMSVGVGNPPTQYNLLIDTGSSNTWVGAGTKYVPTSTSTSTGNSVNVSYGSGSFSGTEYTDEVTLGTNLIIQKQSIGVASTATGFSDVDGILGVGPTDLTSGTVANTSEVPTVTDNLYSQGTITSDSIGISYTPTTSAEATNGEITFGGVDNTKYTGEINFVPITTTSPASNYWGINQTITYGSSGTSILSSTAGIVDTGTTLLLLATNAFQAYEKATGGVLDQTTGLLTITEDQYNSLQSLYFNIGGITYEFTPNAQIWPRSQNTILGGEEGKIYLVASDLGSNSGSGLDFINGFVWLQRYYSVFDTGDSQLGFATTTYTDAETN